MNPLILMAGIVLVPTILIMLARTKAALIFMALCVGAVLSNYVGDTALDMVQMFVRSYDQTTASIVQIGLLLFPVLLTLLFLSRTLSKSKLFMNLLPALLTGIAVLFLVVPLLPPGTSGSIYATDVWNQLSAYQAALLSAAALLSLAQLWATGHSNRIKDKSKKKH